jgi:hypothetical protein
VRELARGTEGRGVGYMLSLLILDSPNLIYFWIGGVIIIWVFGPCWREWIWISEKERIERIWPKIMRCDRDCSRV